MKWLRGMGFILLLLSTHALAVQNIYTGWFSDKAVSGYDTVAFFTLGKPVQGSAKFSYTFQGVDWHFSSAEHLRLFKNNPDKYSPQYGGYCAWAVAAKKKRAPGNPKYWKIVEGKLYLNYDSDVRDEWLEDIPNFIKEADKNWPEMTKGK